MKHISWRSGKCLLPASVLLSVSKDFRRDFSRMAELRSLMPRNCNIMALTATANLATRKKVISNLEMSSCYVLAQNPNKVNIFYEVQHKPSDLMCVFRRMIEDIQKNGVN